MDIGGSGAQGGEHGPNPSITMREIANKVWKRAMYEQMERMKRQMETLTTILHKPRNEQRMACDANVIRDGIATEPDNKRNRDEGIPSVRGQIYRKRNSGVGNQPWENMTMR